MGDGRDYQRTGILEADKATIKKVVYRRRQQEPVFTVEPLFISLNLATACYGWRVNGSNSLRP